MPKNNFSQSFFFNSVTDLVTSLNAHFKHTLHYSGSVAVKMSDAACLMKTCKGRDKVCALVQYYCAIYGREGAQGGRNKLERKCLQLKSGMKNGRKIFKILKFAEGFSKIMKMHEKDSKPFIYRATYIFLILGGMATNILDNILWANWIGLISAHKEPIKVYKDKLSFFKNLWHIFFIATVFILRWQKIRSCLNELKERKSILRRTSYYYPSARRLIKQRRKMRFIYLDSVILVLRIAMLLKRVQFLSYSDGLYNWVGLVLAVLGIVRLLFEKPKWLQIQKRKDQHHQQMIRSGIPFQML